MATSILTLDEEEDDVDAMLTREVQEKEGDKTNQTIPKDEQPTRSQVTQAQKLPTLQLTHKNPSQCDLQTARHLP